MSWQRSTRCVSSHRCTILRRSTRSGEARQALPRRSARRRLRHGVPPDDPAGRLHLSPARAVPSARDPRFGFHGLSVAWVAEQVPVARLVVCHLGGGCSVTAVRDGRSVDTTMGFTPLEGVPMATRAGSGRPWRTALPAAPRRDAAAELEQALEHESGLLALGGTGDVATLIASSAGRRSACARDLRLSRRPGSRRHGDRRSTAWTPWRSPAASGRTPSPFALRSASACASSVSASACRCM